MPSEESQDIKDLRRQMREGRAPLLEAVRQAYPGYLLAHKGLERKNSKVREQLGMLNGHSLPALKSCASLPVTRMIAVKLYCCCMRR